jgi:hypothetical protein
VSAGSLYEAVAQALRIFRDNEWVEQTGSGQTTISVRVKHSEIEHTVRVQDFERWLETGPSLTRRDGFQKAPSPDHPKASDIFGGFITPTAPEVIAFAP